MKKLQIILVGVVALGGGLGSGCAADPGSEIGEIGRASSELRRSRCDAALCTEEHWVEVEPGVELLVVETYSRAALRGHRRRALLMLPATLVTNVIWNARVDATPDYNGLERAAQEGYFAYTLDWYGYGRSDAPADGRDVTAEVMLEHAAAVLEWIRHRRGVSKVDLIGASAGSAIAVGLGGTDSPIPRRHVGGIVLTAHVYADASDLANAFIFTAENEEALRNAPAGYVDTIPPMYGLILASATPQAQGYCFANCPGTYAVGPTLEGFDLPVFAAERGRAPALQFWGTADLISTEEDAEVFQDAYGGPSELIVLEGGGHVPHWEAVRDQFWDETFAFLRGCSP